MFGDRTAEWKRESEAQWEAARFSLLLLFFEAWCSKKLKARGDDSSCTLLHQQHQAARNRRQTQTSVCSASETNIRLFTFLNFSWRAYISCLSAVSKRRGRNVSALTSLLFNPSDGGISERARGSEAPRGPSQSGCFIYHEDMTDTASVKIAAELRRTCWAAFVFSVE